MKTLKSRLRNGLRVACLLICVAVLPSGVHAQATNAARSKPVSTGAVEQRAVWDGGLYLSEIYNDCSTPSTPDDYSEVYVTPQSGIQRLIDTAPGKTAILFRPGDYGKQRFVVNRSRIALLGTAERDDGPNYHLCKHTLIRANGFPIFDLRGREILISGFYIQ